jgi:hypothetical protein
MYDTLEVTRERVATFDESIEVADLELGNWPAPTVFRKLAVVC